MQRSGKSEYLFGPGICVVDIDSLTGEVKNRRFYALDDRGTRTMPMIIERQVRGGFVEARAVATGRKLSLGEKGNMEAPSFMDYLVPTTTETPHRDTSYTFTPSPHHPTGAGEVGESPTWVGFRPFPTR